MKIETVYEIMCIVTVVIVAVSFIIPPEYVLPLLLASTLVLVVLTSYIKEQSREIKTVVVSELTCVSCNAVLIRDFAKGDVVFEKVNTSCPACGNKGMVIRAIYSTAQYLKDKLRLEHMQEEKGKILAIKRNKIFVAFHG
ncbi:MAG: hypothetical protein QXL15_02285 [Candidatus Korarchaeota archaeon]